MSVARTTGMKKLSIIISLLTLLLIGADLPIETIRLTVINKSESDIAIQLNSSDKECFTSKDYIDGQFYYLPVSEGSREVPNVKVFDIQKDCYAMQVLYLQTYDPVYGFKCEVPKANILIAKRNIRIVVLPCGFKHSCPKAIGEPSMWKFIPFPVPENAYLFQKYWLTRMIY